MKSFPINFSDELNDREQFPEKLPEQVPQELQEITKELLEEISKELSQRFVVEHPNMLQGGSLEERPEEFLETNFWQNFLRNF